MSLDLNALQVKAKTDSNRLRDALTLEGVTHGVEQLVLPNESKVVELLGLTPADIADGASQKKANFLKTLRELSRGNPPEN